MPTPLYQVDPVAVRQEIGKDRLLALWRQMLVIRRFEERAELAYKAKSIAGFLHLYIGQEAVATGFFAHLNPGIDSSVTSYRCHAQAILSGVGIDELMAELYGKASGNVKGKGGSMHFFSKEKSMLGGHGIVGGQIPVGTGAAFSAKYRKTGGVSVTFFGDGATPQGTFHESLNMDNLWGLPAIYIIENNQYGMGTAACRSNAVQDLAETKAVGYGMKSFTFDGLDLFASWKCAQEAVAYARRELKPVLIEAKTYRYRGHSVSDAGLYRSKEEVERYKQLDPIGRVQAALQEAGWLSDAEAEAIEEQVREEIAACVKFAEQSPEPALSELSRHVYAEA
jgi:pyruvate dehydrogenase E1 component alpha subunit